MDYMKKMPTVLEAVGIKTKEVHNIFMSQSDSGYSTKTTNSCVDDGKANRGLGVFQVE